MTEAANYQEFQAVSQAALGMQGDRREFVRPPPQHNHGRLYQILFAVQFISVLIIIGCGLAATGSFG